MVDCDAVKHLIKLRKLIITIRHADWGLNNCDLVTPYGVQTGWCIWQYRLQISDIAFVQALVG